MKIVSKLDIILGVFFIIFSLQFLVNGQYLLSPKNLFNLVQLLASSFLGIFLILKGIFGITVLLRKYSFMGKNHKKRIPVEERYYNQGKNNEQLQQYNEALQCYSKSLEFNPNFEPSIKAGKEVEDFLKLNDIMVEKDTKKDWFKYKRMGGIPKPISWQGWACYAIYVSIFFSSILFMLIYNINPFTFTIILTITTILLVTVATLKSNLREIANEYKKGI